MKQKRYSLSMFWNKRDMDEKTKEATISLTVNLPRQQFRVSLKIAATKADFDRALSTARLMSDSAKELKVTLNDYILKAESILDRLQEPTKETFVRLFKAETDLFQSNKTDVLFFYRFKMDEALKEGRVGTNKWFQQCMRCIESYSPKICFEDITEKWIKTYHLTLKNRGNSESTCAMKLRGLKIIFNVAKQQGFIPESCNPFKNISITASAKSKSVLYPIQLKSLYEYQPVGIVETRAKAYFFFCYLANGMNFNDMAHLKWKDIKGDMLTFIREKTKLRCKSGVKEIKVFLHDDMKRIISEYGSSLKKPDDYIFPIMNLKTDLVRQQIDKTRHKRACNRKLAKIGVKLQFDVHLCLNLARHSFATMLKLSGTPLSFISDAMGHTTSKTTEHYLKSIPDENIQQLSGQLLNFA